MMPLGGVPATLLSSREASFGILREMRGPDRRRGALLLRLRNRASKAGRGAGFRRDSATSWTNGRNANERECRRRAVLFAGLDYRYHFFPDRQAAVRAL